jgi:hypothetical protein
MTTTSTFAVRRTNPAVTGFIVAGAALALANALVALAVQTTADVSDDFFRYPWSSSGAFVAFSLFSATLHAFIVRGLIAFRRSAAAGETRPATIGVALAVAGTALLLIGEVASILTPDARVDDTSAQIIGTVLGVGSIVSMIGFLLAGRATARAGVWHGWQRLSPLVTGLWLVVLVPVPLVAPVLLPAGIAIHGLCLLAVAIALHNAESRG